MTREQLSIITSGVQDQLNVMQVYVNRLQFRINDDDYPEMTTDELYLITHTLLNIEMATDELGTYVERCIARYADNIEEVADETLRS